MASKLGISIARRMLVAKAQGKFDQEYSSALELIAPEVDESLQEVREVLAMFRLIGPNGCWCLSRYAQPDLVRRKDNDHDSRCQRTRALMARLAIEKEG